MTESSFSIDLEFENPELIGYDNSTQYLEVYAKFSDFEPKWNDSEPLIRQKIPHQLVDSETNKQILETIGTLQSGTTAVTVVNTMIQYLISGSL